MNWDTSKQQASLGLWVGNRLERQLQLVYFFKCQQHFKEDKAGTALTDLPAFVLLTPETEATTRQRFMMVLK